MKKIYTVTVDGIQHPYPEGTPYQDIAGELQPAYSNEILLVERDGRLCELGKQLDRDCTLKMITIQDKPGMQTYERSAIFLMLKAFYDIVGSEHIERICVEYSLSHALFITAQGSFRLDQPLLEQVESRMKELVSQALPIQKHSIPTDDAIAMFERRRLYDKAKLLSCRISSKVNYYSLEDFSDYFYGYMVPNTKYITCFHLELFDCGFILRLPDPACPAQLAPFHPSWFT